MIKHLNRSSFLFILVLVCLDISAQDRFQLSLETRSKGKRIPEKTVVISKTSEEIELDGILDEEIWKTSDMASDFHQQFPFDDTAATAKTEVRLAYDDNNLFVGIICYDKVPGKYIVESLRRDFNERSNDNFMLVLDPFDELTNGYVFAVNPYGVQLEGLVTGGGGGFTPVSDSWDNIWYSKVHPFEGGWRAEIKIPFKSIRYADDISLWNIQFVRNDLKLNERSTWTTVKRQYRSTAFTYSGGLKWDGAPPKAGSNMAFIPYVSGAANQDFSESDNINSEARIGFDGKIGLSSSLNLDLTVNPDFSTVEVDRQQTNITRFELFFPERRQFFLENSDLFSNFGARRSRVFFSRRIGLQSSLLFGARLSGQVGNGLRVGLLNAQTENKRDENGDVPAYNFTVATFQKQVFGRSSISGIITNKQGINFNKDQLNGFNFEGENKYNRTYGLQYNLLTPNDKWTGDMYLFRSDTPGKPSSGNWVHGSSIRYNTRKFFVFWSHEYVGDNFEAEMGFFPRKSYIQFGPFMRYSIFPEDSPVNRHSFSFRSRYFLDLGWKQTDRQTSVGYRMEFQNRSEFEIELNDNYVFLFDDFDPTRSDDVIPLPEGSEYNWQSVNINYESDGRKDFAFELRSEIGGFYNGSGIDVSGSVRYRIRPKFNLEMNFTYNQINLPDPYPDGNFWLIGPRIDVTFSNSIFWTTFIQYNEQADNVNLNSRLQWRFAPVSDLFLVYTENYLPENLNVKNRGIVLKMSYWLNL
jgi:hypothetical protein